MKRLTLLLCHLLVLLPAALRAQYTSEGKIEYTRKVNLYAQWEDNKGNTSNWFDQVKNNVPKFYTSNYELYFNTAHSIYRQAPTSDAPNNVIQMSLGPVSKNIVLTDFHSKKVEAYKEVYEDKFLVKDTMRQIQWKITDEIRTIANYKCRKAVGIICDSVYVVAFYTDDIMVSGGPEMACGLPGMIMEFAVPRLHTTWTATNVDIALPKDADFTLPDNGKQITEKQLFETMQKSMKDWGDRGQRNIWWSML